MLPIWFPTTTLVLDDDPLFLDSFAYSLGRKVALRAERLPEVAIKTIRNNNSKFERLAELAFGNGVSQNKPFQQYDPIGKQNTIWNYADASAVQSVAIIDFAMPGRSGIDVCREIKGLPVQKILLTGKAGDDTAVAAFNEGLIDKFMVKQDPELLKKLPQEILSLQTRFFQNLARSIYPSTRLDMLELMRNSAACNSMQDTFDELGVESHIVLRSLPGFLVRTRGQRELLVITYDHDTMQAHREILADSGAPKGLRRALNENARQMPCFPTEEGFFDPAFSESWKSYVFDAVRVVNDEWCIAVTDRRDLIEFHSKSYASLCIDA